jgi:hypothetical protein
MSARWSVGSAPAAALRACARDGGGGGPRGGVRLYSPRWEGSGRQSSSSSAIELRASSDPSRWTSEQRATGDHRPATRPSRARRGPSCRAGCQRPRPRPGRRRSSLARSRRFAAGHWGAALGQALSRVSDWGCACCTGESPAGRERWRPHLEQGVGDERRLDRGDAAGRQQEDVDGARHAGRGCDKLPRRCCRCCCYCRGGGGGRHDALWALSSSSSTRSPLLSQAGRPESRARAEDDERAHRTTTSASPRHVCQSPRRHRHQE